MAVGQQYTGLWARLTRPWGDPPPSQYDLGERCLLGIGAVIFFIGGWYGTQALAMRGERFYDLATPLDLAAPLVVEAAWGYLLMYLFTGTTFILLKEQALFRRTLAGLMLQSTVAFAFFVAFPVRMVERPDLAVAAMSGPSAALTGIFYAVDQPYNLFPSLHLASAVWCSFALAQQHPRVKPLLALIVVIIAASVVLVRQHYIADAVAGTVLAAAFRPLLSWRRRSANRPALRQVDGEGQVGDRLLARGDVEFPGE